MSFGATRRRGLGTGPWAGGPKRGPGRPGTQIGGQVGREGAGAVPPISASAPVCQQRQIRPLSPSKPSLAL